MGTTIEASAPASDLRTRLGNNGLQVELKVTICDSIDGDATTDGELSDDIESHLTEAIEQSLTDLGFQIDEVGSFVEDESTETVPTPSSPASQRWGDKCDSLRQHAATLGLRLSAIEIAGPTVSLAAHP